MTKQISIKNKSEKINEQRNKQQETRIISKSNKYKIKRKMQRNANQIKSNEKPN